MSQKSAAKEMTHILVTIGALNWGLIGAGNFAGGADWNVLHMVFGGAPIFETSLYLAIGLASLYGTIGCRSHSSCCQ